VKKLIQECSLLFGESTFYNYIRVYKRIPESNVRAMLGLDVPGGLTAVAPCNTLQESPKPEKWSLRSILALADPKNVPGRRTARAASRRSVTTAAPLAAEPRAGEGVAAANDHSDATCALSPSQRGSALPPANDYRAARAAVVQHLATMDDEGRGSEIAGIASEADLCVCVHPLDAGPAARVLSEALLDSLREWARADPQAARSWVEDFGAEAVGIVGAGEDDNDE
jgi:hypothetical protein